MRETPAIPAVETFLAEHGRLVEEVLDRHLPSAATPPLTGAPGDAALRDGILDVVGEEAKPGKAAGRER